MAGRGAFDSAPNQTVSDEQLMRELAGGRQEALGPLYSRYVGLIFNLACHSLDQAAAEELVQDVFLAVWRKADSFDPTRGSFRSWVLQIAHLRVVNELRRQSRRPRLLHDPDDELLSELADPSPEPAEAAWVEERRAALRAAVEGLPPPQRQAVGLAFYSDLTHQQVARSLDLPLGTAKTRIRTGLLKLRGQLEPLLAGLVLLIGLTALGTRWQSERESLGRYERALAMATMSDGVDLRLAGAPEMPSAAHARYHGRPGDRTAVVTYSSFPPAPDGRTYQAWALHQGVWTSLGTAQPDAQGRALIIVEDAVLVSEPEAVQVTLEPVGGRPAPNGPVVASWAGG